MFQLYTLCFESTLLSELDIIVRLYSHSCHGSVQDGKISLSERRILWILGVTSSAIVICEVVVIIWVLIIK